MCAALAGFAALGPGRALASDVIDLEWSDLIPEGETWIPPEIQGLLPHDENAMASRQPPSSGVRTDWNGKTVRISGFIVPLEFEGTRLKAFMLAPFVGACIHVPPPPANQLVLVTTEEPYETDTMFDPATVTGLFGTVSTATELAHVGYALAAETIVPYRR